MTLNAAPGSVVLVRDAEWLVTSVEQASDGYFVNVIGLSELVRDTEATFSTAIDTVIEVDSTKVQTVADSSPGFRRSRLWLEATLRKTPVGITDPSLTAGLGGLSDPLDYQAKAVRKALDPDKLRPRILLADAVGLGKPAVITCDSRDRQSPTTADRLTIPLRDGAGPGYSSDLGSTL